MPRMADPIEDLYRLSRESYELAEEGARWSCGWLFLYIVWSGAPWWIQVPHGIVAGFCLLYTVVNLYFAISAGWSARWYGRKRR